MAELGFYFKTFGFSARNFFNSIKGILPYIKNFSILKKQLKNNKKFRVTSLRPCLNDRFENAGSLPQHYFFQDLYVARQIFQKNPEKHVDIGSRIDGFVSHLASFREVEVFDIREMENNIPGVKFIRADLMNENFPYDNYADSVSSLHAIEHFGLGRYGDPVDADGYLKGLNNIFKMLKKRGTFYFSVPIGEQRIEFNAHRVFSVKYLMNLFEENYYVRNLSYINDDNKLFTNVTPDESEILNNFNCRYGCGIFILEKK